MIASLDSLTEILPLTKISGWFFDGVTFTQPTRATLALENGIIAHISTGAEPGAFALPEHVLCLPGGINLHVHGRDALDVLPGMPGDQSHKEDSYTLSLALAQGGTTFAMCMLNFNKRIQTPEEYAAQRRWMSTELPHRKKPIMDLDAYITILPDSEPLIDDAWFKLLWDTFSAAKFQDDGHVRETLRAYTGRRVKVHGETMKGILSCPALPHHERRPKQAAINATRMMLECAQEYRFNLDMAHIGTAEEIRLINAFNQEMHERGVPIRATYEITPQVLMLDVSTFEKVTGYPLRWSQQNPPLRTYADRMRLLATIGQDAIYASDHAPHTEKENENGISGMPQASTEGQAYLEQLSLGYETLETFVQKRSLNPGKLLEERGYKMGWLQSDYDASFTLVSLGKPSRIMNADVLSKCAWTPYQNITFSNTIEGVVIKGMLYTQAALQKLRPPGPS